jgi:hypothetical protein
MTKKRILGILVIFLIFISFSLLQAQVNSTEEQQKIDKAYSCLIDKVEENCDSLTTEEKIFSLLAINECKAEVIDDSSDEECWPSDNCRLKTTAQAVLALDNAGVNIDEAQQWLLSKNKTPSELIWYLQIESNNQTTCNIGYTGFSSTIEITEDKKINRDAGTCLSLAQDNYWLEIFSSPFCYNQEFSISCDNPYDNDFSTTLLFKEQTSDTIHVFQQTSSAVAKGTIVEKVESFCFREGGIGNPCNYEGSLWAALALDSLGEDMSPYLPYLITLAEDNQRFLPDAFLYLITSNPEYSDSLLSKQKTIGTQYYWHESTDIYYDTALALFPFRHETRIEKTNSKQWLLETQDANGCWQDNTRNTAFILASIGERDFFNGGNGDGLQDCKSAGNYCVTKGSCEGQTLSDYCPGILSECCTIQTKQLTCAEQDGKICSSNEECSGTEKSAADLISGETCCVGGSCGVVTQTISDCKQQNGTCKSSCLDDEEEIFYSCEFIGDICCSPKTIPGKSYVWIWVLLILIVLVVIGIIFRDKLRDFWFRIKSKFKGPKPGPRPGLRRLPPRPPRYPMRRPMPERRILPVLHQPIRPVKRRPSKSQTELDKVLKKLKDMGK